MKHAMTTSMDYKETAENTLDLVKMLRAFAPASSGQAVKTSGKSENKEKVCFLPYGIREPTAKGQEIALVWGFRGILAN